MIKGATSGEGIAPLAWPEILALVTQFYRLNLDHYDAHYAASPVKRWLVYLRAYYHPAATLFEDLKRLHLPAEIGPLLQRAMGEHGNEPIPAHRAAA